MPLSPGARLGPYEILSPLGAGGMGEVYRAKDPRLGREVAIKVLPASFSKNSDRLKRFEQEARAAGVLNHPNLTIVYDIGQHDGAPYIVQELLEGETLRSELAGGRFSPRKAIDYAIQIAQGLAAAHEKGIVHRDLKPENLFVTREGRVKILDFGLAKLIQAEDPSRPSSLPTATEPGVVMGTAGYMSPEQVKAEPVDARSDIFALGVILYEMLSGQRPFKGDSPGETMAAILKEDPPDLSATNKNINPGFERLVRHCLEKTPERRFQSARDLAYDLETLSGVSGTVAAPRGLAPSSRNWRK
ncbi:MAG TPA: serine/threonine-protein kinase, partial [Candidatus Eisenbacteria bacterium]